MHISTLVILTFAILAVVITFTGNVKWLAVIVALGFISYFALFALGYALQR